MFHRPEEGRTAGDQPAVTVERFIVGRDFEIDLQPGLVQVVLSFIAFVPRRIASAHQTGAA